MVFHRSAARPPRRRALRSPRTILRNSSAFPLFSRHDDEGRLQRQRRRLTTDTAQTPDQFTNDVAMVDLGDLIATALGERAARHAAVSRNFCSHPQLLNGRGGCRREATQHSKAPRRGSDRRILIRYLRPVKSFVAINLMEPRASG